MIGKKYEYDAMAKCEQRLWWYRSLHDLSFRTIKKNNFSNNVRILDAGCGTGGLLLYLKEKGFTDIAGFDLSPDAVAYAQEVSAVDVRLLDITHAGHIYPENYFDIVVSHDILCLLPEGEDKTALSQLLYVLKPGGLLLMNLPALGLFRGTHDIAVGIQRRYSLKALQQLVDDRAEIRATTYWPFVLSPLIFFVRSFQKIKSVFVNRENIVSDVKMPPAFLNTIFYSVTGAENRRMGKKPWGSSLFSVLQKRY
jgi:SAM-dependent methyltransferase